MRASRQDSGKNGYEASSLHTIEWEVEGRMAYERRRKIGRDNDEAVLWFAAFAGHLDELSGRVDPSVQDRPGKRTVGFPLDCSRGVMRDSISREQIRGRVRLSDLPVRTLDCRFQLSVFQPKST
jgi:hypothetical protein